MRNNNTNHEGRKTMETVKKELEQMGRGCVRTMWDILVLRRGDSYIVGRDFINIYSTVRTLDNAAATVVELTKNN